MANNTSLFGWAIIFLLSIGFVFGYGILKFDRENQIEMIKKYEEKTSQGLNAKSHYFGYIEFPDYQTSRLIEYGNPNMAIEKFNIGIFGTIPEDLQTESLILVGHNRPNQFSVVSKLKNGNRVMVYHHRKKYYYTVFDRIVVLSTSIEFLKKQSSYDLVLITCSNDSNKRIVIFCKL